MGEVQIGSVAVIDSIIVPSNRKRRLGDITGLCESIREIGLINPITLSEDNVLISGLHRLEAFRRLGRATIPAAIVSLDELDKELAEIDENLIRNELTCLQRGEHLKRRKEIYEAKHPQARKPKGGRPKKNGEIISPFSVDTAEKAKVSPRTVQQEVKIATDLTDEERDELRETPVADSKTDLLKLVREKDPKQRKRIVKKLSSGKAKNVKEAKKQLSAEDSSKKAKQVQLDPQRCQLILSGIEELAEKLEGVSVDVIVTDPPYVKDDLHVFQLLGGLAARVLKDGGSCIVMAGQSYLPRVMADLETHLSYHWMLAYLTPGGQSVQLWQRKVNTFWKPLLWYVKGEYTGEWRGDVCSSHTNDNDKRFHYWGQSVSGMADIIEHVSKAGDTILDPFCGGGTTGVAALALGRRFIGADIDKESLVVAKGRLAT